MAENDSTEAGDGAKSDTRQMTIQKIYVKDLSFESPSSPQIFAEPPEHEVDLNLSTNTTSLGHDIYEVNLAITITVRAGEKTAYLIEVQQAGVFLIQGFSDEERAPILGSYCPNTLFPFAREAVSDIVNKGGFPQFILAPMNFDAIYAQHVQQNAASAQTEH